MPQIGRSVVSPFNPQNLVLPSRISVWFAPFDAQGRQSEFFELGDVSDIEINIAETFAEKKSARQGTFQTIKRLINDLVGEITMNLSEVVGRNLELLFRPAQVLLRDGVANALSVWHESTRPRLTGTTASDVAPGIAQERVDGGALNELSLTLLGVTDLVGNVTYLAGTDYIFTQAIAGVFDSSTLTFALFTTAVGDEILLTEDDGSITTLVAGTEFEDGPTAGSTEALAAGVAEAINAYSSSYHATVVASVVTVNHNSLSAIAPADMTVTGATLIADVGAGPFVFAGFVATVASTIERISTGAIPNGGEVKVTFTFEREAVEYQLQSGQVLEGAMKLQILSTSGPQGFYEFFRVNLEIGGNITVNPQEFMVAPLKATILSGGDGRRGRFVQACNFSDFFVQSSVTACSAVA